MELVKQDGKDSLEMLIRRAVVKDPFLSFPRPENSQDPLSQLFHAFERPGWPLLTPLKIQMHKCKNCTREFCSPVNYRRHNRMHRRIRKLEKDSSKERDALGQKVKDQKKYNKEDKSTTSDEQQYPAESSSPLSVASDSEAQRSDSVLFEDSSSLEDPQILETNNERNGETQELMLDDDGLGNDQNMEKRSGRRQMERSQQGMLNGFHGNHAPTLGGMRKNGTNRDTRASTTKVWTRKSDNHKSIPDKAVALLDQTKKSELLIGTVSVTIQNSCPSREQNQTKCNEEEGRTKTVESKPTFEQSAVKVGRPVSSQGKKVSSANENADKEDKNSNSTAPKIKTAHHISLQFNNHEAKASLAKRWKEATSADHVTLVLSQETDILGNNNNTHDSANGVIGRPKLRMKLEKGTKVKYIPNEDSLKT